MIVLEGRAGLKCQESSLLLCCFRSSAHRAAPERSGVVCRVKYCNSLPDIPFDPKFVTYPFDPNRFVQYKATSLEKQHKHELLTEPDLGVVIDLINPDTYRIDNSVILDNADEKLLEEEIQAPSTSKRSQQHAKVVPWMRKTEYISTEFNRYGISNEKPEVKIGVSVKQQFTEEEIYKDRDSQIAAIEKTFVDANKEVTQHYSKPRVIPVEVMPVFPDFKMWINPCAQVIFDSDPAPKEIAGPGAVEMMSQAMIRGMMDEEGNQFVAYFLPNEDTIKKRKRDNEECIDYMPEDVYEYKISREYNWNVKNKASKGYEENYFFIFRDSDGVYYNELETRVRLSKRRAKGGHGVQSNTNAMLVVKHRDMNEKELEAQEARRAQLENHEPEDEEEMDHGIAIPGSEDEKEKESGSEKAESADEHSASESEPEEEKEDKASNKSKSDAGSVSGDERQAREARDEEEIFGSDDESGNEGRRNESGQEESGSDEEQQSEEEEDEEEERRSRSASNSGSEQSDNENQQAAQSGSEQGTDSSENEGSGSESD
ncbi:RNA polymerase II-associated factor 1 homolog [Scyliorhinus canicula]|uniref:RNA polymerase II-associated factor 1 homolog n=1 Tax=Scyliorhinus canicula TaxID=7830 RepID=UPI0018F62E08|nr:RNA polymerase II-associated factor 1 homolog [Scyliorhinus canicula]